MSTPIKPYSAQYWKKELDLSKKWFRRFHKGGDNVVKTFLDDRREEDNDLAMVVTRLNLFHANIVTWMSLLFGKLPKVEVNRRFADADDDVARVAGEILTRILNNDVEVAGEDLATVYRSALQDRLLPGLGTARLKYHLEENERHDDTQVKEGEYAPETGETGGENPGVAYECAEIIYTHWKDILWSPARTYPELRWKAYRSYLTKEEFKERFPDANVEEVEFSTNGPLKQNKWASSDADISPTEQVEVWEIWCKTSNCVYWYAQGAHDILDEEEDPLGLEGFWPDPPPMCANLTTSKYIPKSDYSLAKDLYTEIDELESRIAMLTRACKCVGVYNKSNKDVQRMLTEGVENELIPVDNWAAFAESGGMEGSIQFLPIKDVADTITILTQKQNDKIQQLYQVTGMNDVMRGAATREGTPETATQLKQEESYGSVRVEAMQNEFARWVSDTQRIKAEIIANLYQPQTIIEQSNIMETEDGQNQQLIMAAIQLIKDPGKSKWRIQVRPESLAIADYNQTKGDRMEFIMGMAQYMQSAAPLLEKMPNALPFLMKFLKWLMAGFKGSAEMEGAIDQVITQLIKQPPQPPPNPDDKKAEVEMQKAQMEMQQSREEHQANMTIQQQKGQMELMQMQQKFSLEMQKMQMEMKQMMMEFALKLKEMQMKLGYEAKSNEIEAQSKEREQAAQFEFNTAEREHEAATAKEDREHEAEVAMESGDAELTRDRERAKLQSSKPNGGARS
jgi:hypothetical protein